jgi:T5SS/PEP-CTERM-associated repeat protein
MISNHGYLGDFSFASGTATVTGAGSKWTNYGSLLVGGSGNGTLTIDKGGQVTTASGYVGYDHSGNLLITDVGSQWTSTGSLIVGKNGNGLLNITHGGTVKVGSTLTIDQDLDNDSFINMATGGMLALAGDADASLTQFLDLVQGTDAIRYWDTSLADWSLLTNATFGTDYTLEYLTAGDLAGYTLLTVGMVGDFDGNRVVDGRDFLAWQRNPELGSLADWQNAYGNSIGTATAEFSNIGASPVPEPGGVVLLLGLVVLSGAFVRARESLIQG